MSSHSLLSRSGAFQPSQGSLFFLAEASSTFLWNRLSDHIGRKPVLMMVSGGGIGVFVHDVKSFALGYGRACDIYDQFRFFQDLHPSRGQVPERFIRDITTADPPDSRCIAGILNGNMGVVKSMMGEITDSTNRAQVSGLFPVVWAVGATIGYAT